MVSRRNFLKAAGAIAAGVLSPLEALAEQSKPANVEKDVPLQFQLGTPTIGLGLGADKASVEEYLKWYQANGLIVEGGPKPILEIPVIAKKLGADGKVDQESAGTDLSDIGGKSYLSEFDGLKELSNKYGVDLVVLAFFQNGSQAHMLSNDRQKRHRAEFYLESCVDIARHIGAKTVIGPSVVEHQNFDDDLNIRNAVTHLAAVSDYAYHDDEEKNVKIAFEVLRKEESILNKAADAIRLINEVKQYRNIQNSSRRKIGRDTLREINNIGIQGDLCHATAEGYTDLTKYIDDVKDHLMYLHLSRYEKWGSANNRGQLTADDRVGSQLQKVYERLLYHGLKIPTTVEVPHYAFKDALGRKNPILDAKFEAEQTTELNNIVRIETLASYKLAQQAQRNAIKAHRLAA